jgi:hypothetical protein
LRLEDEHQLEQLVRCQRICVDTSGPAAGLLEVAEGRHTNAAEIERFLVEGMRAADWP